MSDYGRIRRKAKKGDVLLTYNRENVLSKIIADVTESHWSHVAMYIGNGNIIESTIGGVQISPLNKYLKDKYDVCLLRHVYLNRWKRSSVVRGALRYVGYDYGYFQLFWYLILRIFKRSEDPHWQKDIEDGAMVCSEAIAQAYQDVGLEVKPGYKPAGIEPADFYESPYFRRIVEVIHGD